MSNTLQASDIFVIEEATKTIEKTVEIPSGFVPVTFTSGDKLGPKELHFRNYKMSELLDLASSTPENETLNLIRVLNGMNYEKFDCSSLHVENIKEILITIYANFWGSELQRQPFYIDTEIENRDVEENIGYIDIPINSLEITKLKKEFRVPFSIIDDITNQKVRFILPTLNHVFVADKFIKEKYKEEESKYLFIKSILETRESLIERKMFEEATKLKINPEEEEKYTEFDKKKSLDYLKVLQAQLLYGVDDKAFVTLEEKVEAFNEKVDVTTWMRYNDTVEKYSFGVSDSYSFEYNGETITRGFSFRYSDFLPSVEQGRDTGYTVQFDD